MQLWCIAVRISPKSQRAVSVSAFIHLLHMHCSVQINQNWMFQQDGVPVPEYKFTYFVLLMIKNTV